MKMNWFLLCVFILIGVQLNFAQKNRKGSEKDEKDQSNFKNYVSWAWQGHFDPYMEVLYGVGDLGHLKFEGEFAPIGSAEFRIGYGESKERKKHIISIDERYIFGSFVSNDLSIKNNDPGGIKTEMVRFGIGNRLGFGYKVGPIGLIPFNQSTFVWTKLQSERPTSLSQNDKDILDRYENTFRFGHSTEGGVKLELASFLSITGSYEANVVFPRHLFWKWLGSYAIVGVASNIVSVFSEDIVNSSPILGPLIYFVLKNAITFAFYTGMKDEMNWPFKTETPITYETFRVSGAIRF